ncbi:hypothetical protein [Cronobacter dublinensis]|uniref:hypothetical protein n=1 Tax=Cronobacter dublinensis TaxID=413497 RepID=UPI0010728F5F|nr:hypothetical protein [Cronobacter dublinensis]
MKKLILLLSLVIFKCWAGSFPVITSINPEYTGNNHWEYHITQRVMDVGPSVDVVPTTGSVLFGHRHNPAHEDVFNSIYDGFDLAAIHANGRDSISQLAMQIYYRFGATVSVVGHTGDDYGKNECVGYVYTTENYSVDVPWSTVRPPAMCMNVPPPNQWCLIKTPELFIDHGIIKLKDAEGHSASTSLNVDCTTQMSVKFTLIGDESYIYLKPSGKSALKVNGQPLRSKIDLLSGSSTLKIEDLLTGVTKEGVNTGNSVLIMMPY